MSNETFVQVRPRTNIAVCMQEIVAEAIENNNPHSIDVLEMFNGNNPAETIEITCPHDLCKARGTVAINGAAKYSESEPCALSCM